MDTTPPPPTTINNTPTSPEPAPATAKSPEHEIETPTRINPATKPLSFSNGVLKRHHHSHLHHHLHHPLATNHPVVVTYKECLKNHAAGLGGHSLDGCGEFMPSPNATAADPTSLKCAACGCHRNFHRRESEDLPIATTHILEYQPHHRHHPPPPQLLQASNRSPNSASPPPISSSYYPSAPHILLALSTGLAAAPENTASPTNTACAMLSPGSSTRKRFRTKFSQEQKEKMQRFAEKVGWKMQKRDDDLVQEFCREAGVDRGVLKVWMHNNKNTYGKRDNANGCDNNILEEDPNNNYKNNNCTGNTNIKAEINGNDGTENPSHHFQNDGAKNGGANGSSSS